MSKSKARVFVPLTKVDETQRLVYGCITQEILDKSNEVMDYTTSKPLFEKWSNDIHEASNGLSKGNVRVMHGLTAAGKLTELNFDDMAKSIDVCAKIVDDGEWEKVIEGVYTGFSVGGSYAKRWTEEINGEKVKKFTANPNEVSIVDNPCVPSACFSMFKADGTEEQVEFKVENDDEAWPGFAKVAVEEVVPPATETPPAPEPQGNLPFEPTASAISEVAGALAKEAGDGTTWMDHIQAARDTLMKAAQEVANESTVEAVQKTVDTPAADNATSETAVEKVTPPGIKQRWLASDDTPFEKKAECEAYEATLVKTELSEADKLRKRLAEAVTPQAETQDPSLMEDYDRLGKAIQAIEQPFENGEPKLEKGMYTVSRFANVLWDLGALCRKIAKEGVSEGDDASDKAVSEDMKKAIGTLSESFKAYVDNQLTELMAGIDDDVCVEVYDYYSAAAKEDGDNQLAKDVCSLIDERRDPSRERREELSKAFGVVEVEELADELSPPLQKRFDDLQTENDELKKVAGEAVEKVEELSKRVETIENKPAPRAPRNVASLPGDEGFLGKAGTPEEKIAVLDGMLKTLGPDALALQLIKHSQTQGQPLHLQR